MNLDRQLIQECENGNLEKIKFLVSQGADIRDQNDVPICGASGIGHLETVKWLALHGADIRAQNNHPICLASYNGHLETVKWLFLHGANNRDVSLEHQKLLAGLVLWKWWRRRIFRLWARFVLPIFFRPDFPGGKKMEKD